MDKEAQTDGTEPEAKPKSAYEMSENEAEVHDQARRRFRKIMDKSREVRLQCREDRRFRWVPGAMWEGDDGEMFDNKPMLEVNKIALSCDKIISEFRNNPITADFVSRDGAASDELADVLDGLYRSDEQDSNGQEAYDTAFDEALCGGIGGFRLTTVYEDEEDPDNDYQRVRFDPIYDADQSIFLDANSKSQTGEDAMYGFILSEMSKEAYREEYDDNPSDWPKDILDQDNEYRDWIIDDAVTIAEYFVIEEDMEEYIYFEDIGETQVKLKAEDYDAKKQKEFEDIGTVETHRRTIKVKSVYKYVMSGAKIIQPRQKLAGKYIPIVPVYGKRAIVDNVERCSGHVRLMKDIQRINNMVYSRYAEISSKSTIEKPILHPEQIAGHEAMWSDDVVEDYPYLLINQLTDASGNPQAASIIGTTKPPNIPQADAALYQMLKSDMEEMLGNMRGGDEIRSNVGKDVVEAIHSRLDMQTYIYVSNMSKAVQHGAKIWLSMAKEIYVEDGRIMKSVSKDGKTASIKIGRKVTGPDGEIISTADLTSAKFNVYTSVAPAAASRKSATVRTLTSMMAAFTGDPETQRILALAATMYTEGEGMGDIRDHARMQLVKMGVVKPSDEEQKMMDEQAAADANKPNPEVEFIKAEAVKSTAQAKEAEAKTKLAEANAKKSSAQALEILSKMNRAEREELLSIYEKLSNTGFYQQVTASPA